MEIAALILGILGFILGLAGFGAGSWAVVQVLAWKRSTHRITHIPPVIEESRFEEVIPPRVYGDEPTTRQLSVDEIAEQQKRQQLEDEFERSVWEE